VEQLRGTFGDLGGLVGDLVRADRRSILHRTVWSTMEWIRVVDVPEDLLISVITPTRNRSGLLRRAMSSVAAQRYPRWEHIVVNDGSEDDTESVLSSAGDQRVRPVRGQGGGASSARNLGLEAARGDLIAYLDDDNVMHPEWLRAAVWALGERGPDASVAYGARIVEEVGVIGPGGDRELSAPMQLEPFDRERLRLGNYIDLGTIVHRRGVPEARFDEELPVLHDWDLIIRLTAEEEPLLLPAVAVLYGTGAPDRLTGSDRRFRDLDLLRARGTVAQDATVG
jgi:glycosyltransferase involved in cell wall biosynthesis